MHTDSRDTGVKNVRHRRRAGDDNFTDVAFHEMMEHGHIHLPVHVISSLNSCIQEKRHYRQKKTQSTCIYLTEMHTRTFACSKDVLCF